MANEGQDVYLECHRVDTNFKYPTWYSFDTDTKEYGTGYYWEPHNPMKREKLTNVFINPTYIYFKQGTISGSINRETLYKWDGAGANCQLLGYQKAKDKRQERLEELTKNNKI